MKSLFLYSIFILSGITVQAADLSESSSEFEYNGHKLSVSSGEFLGEPICSIDLDDQHPKEFQVSVEGISKPSFEDFVNRFKAYQKKGCVVTSIDSKGNAHSYPINVTNGDYFLKAICFNGSGSIQGFYLTNKKVYKSYFLYEFSDKELIGFKRLGLLTYMEKLLKKNCAFYK
ncbi:MAG: hypothetical protein ACI4V7_08375 [Succinivibrionaceae bacterium]